MKCAEVEPALSLILVSFMAMGPDEQLGYFGNEVPRLRGIPSSPPAMLLGVLQLRMWYLFDHYPSPCAQPLIDSLGEALQTIARGQLDSFDDFVSGEEWEHVRRIAREMLEAASVSPVAVPSPLPLQEWAGF